MADDKTEDKTDDKPAGKAAESSAAATATGESKADAKSDAKAGKDTKGGRTMRVRVASPFKVFFDEDAYSLSGENATGPFDILPRHHNFITLLNECELSIKTSAAKPTRVRISGGIMHVKADQVVVFLNV